ncbi:proline racemase family protein [Sporosarcina sp. NPDC096371]|uniref:proline racemase family protein n=1 Tax=Sporosarcina sp. NPDC096371 TaxID=3364530 RepID=UPI0037FFAF7C
MNFEKMYNTIDTHVGGEAFRIVTQSPIAFRGSDVHANHDELQRGFTNEKNLLLNEPRGHRGMHGCIVTSSSNADFQLLFFNHQAVTNFKYEGLLTTVTALIETGNVMRTADDCYRVETVNGIYKVKARIDQQEVTAVSIESGTCFEVNANPDYVTVRVDNARDYLLYALPETIPGIELEHLAALNNWGIGKTAELTKGNVAYEGVILVESGAAAGRKVRSVTFEKDGYILRSPGVDSTFAILTSLLNTPSGPGEIENESIFGSSLTAKALGEGECRFELETEAFVTGSHEFIFDQDDPLKDGFLLV